MKKGKEKMSIKMLFKNKIHPEYSKYLWLYYYHDEINEGEEDEIVEEIENLEFQYLCQNYGGEFK